ncbi:MAG TPA: patatin-like phospholipase family protein [Aliidongia sp.]|uniref:patatin-like phospholipase family protein n=1 Tax=Aliidongia sp. TaxID=1914230 RepID=UPI002DDCE341|nr:patatin-like phospholipase family protein [Aliidongia sp.]HEV2677609.1 patatin-like phospholipase family protein [Aliidongia sp.]
MAPFAAPPRPASYDKKVALVLQGGGALGSYQAGVYEALASSDYAPDWIAGISIGAINAALIAGNAPEDRVDRLRAFWNEITSPPPLWPGLPKALDTPSLSAAHAVLFGQPGFFAPKPVLSWLLNPPPLSYYDTTALKGTLERLVDFDRINAGEVRFSVGAVNVRTGNFAYFDNADITIRPEHVMASGALPPGFPPVEIDGEFYWDGGLVSNTPLQYVIDTLPRRSRLTFQVDLFNARGPLPTDLDTVGEREKDIRYSSRTRAGTETARTMHDVRHIINDLLEQLPEVRQTPEGQILYEFACVTTMDIVELIYRPTHDQGSAKDYEFGHATMLARWAQGLSDAQATLSASPWLAPMPPEVGVRTFDVLGDAAPTRHARTA